MFLKHGAKKLNEIELVAPTGFEPVFQPESRGDTIARRCVTRSKTSASLIAHHAAPSAHRSATTKANAASIAVGDMWLNAGTRAKTAHEVTKRARPKTRAVRRHSLTGISIMRADGTNRI